MSEERVKRDHLGDGLYARHDGFHVWLETHNGYSVTNAVALEPAVLDAFLRWVSNRAKREVNDGR